VAEGSGIVVPVDGQRHGKTLTAGRKVTVGIRPHDFLLAPAGESTTEIVGNLRVEIVEALGFEAFAHGWLTASGPRVIVRIEASQVSEAKTAEKLALRVDRAHVHLFDAATGNALSEAR
jgi:ABC-type sugar transport system ATPase subunit